MKIKLLLRMDLNLQKKIKENPDLLILDEINLACAIGLLDINEVLNFLELMAP